MLENDGMSVSMVSLPDLSLPEMNVIPLVCWQNIPLSKIWIPSRLLTNRKNPSSTWETRGVFHTLEKRGHARQIESFSVYSDSDEDESDIFQSDSDDAFDLDSISNESTEKTVNCSGLKSSVKSNISLNEILNSNTEVDITSFEFKKNNKYASKEVDKSQSNKKNKNSKKKNKVVKSVTLDEFLEDYAEEDKQDAYANDYMQKVLAAKHKGIKEDEVQLKDSFEFPDLNFSSKEIEFIHNDKTNMKKPEITLKTVTQILCQPDDDANVINHAEIASPELETTLGKLVIENIPSEICHEDIYTLLSGYGEIKNFALVPEEDFLKAVVEIDLMCDMDWIIDCLNGTEPFGASSRVLKCYKG